MTPRKKTDLAPPRSTPQATEVATQVEAKRKPWKKRTPFDIVLDQVNRLREDVIAKEEELNQAKQQLQKLEKILDAV